MRSSVSAQQDGPQLDGVATTLFGQLTQATGSAEAAAASVPTAQTATHGPIAVFNDPSTENTAFQFNDGQIVNGFEQYDTVTATIGLPVSPDWGITQWGAPQYYNPTVWVANDKQFTDPALGTPWVTWTVPDGQNAVSLYNTPNYGTVYGLYSTNEGGTCNFIGTINGPTTYAGSTNFARLVTYSLNAKIGYADPTPGNAGYTTFESGFLVAFNAPGTANYNPNLPFESAYLQYMITDSRGTPGELLYRQSNGQFLFNANYSANTYLPYQSSTGGLVHISYELNTAMTTLAAYVAGALGVTGTAEGAAIENLADWTLGGMYVGTEDGIAPIEADISHVSVLDHPAVPYDAAAMNQATGAMDYATGTAGQLFTYADGGPVQVTSDGPDTIDAGSGPLTVVGAGSAVTVAGGQSATTITGSAAATYQGTGGPIQGSATLADTGADIVFQTAGAVSVTGSSAVTFHAGSAAASIAATAAPSETIDFIGASGSATITGGGGHETIAGGTGALSVAGGAGTQIITANQASALVVTGGAGLQQITGNANPATITGGAGSVLVSGASTLDFIGGAGPATISAGTAAGETMLFHGGAGAATLHGGAGNETLIAGAGSLVDDAGAGTQNVQIGAGADTVFQGTGAMAVTDNGQGAVTIIGGTGQMTLNLGLAHATVYLSSFAGGSFQTGAMQNDIIVAGGVSQTITETEQADTIAASASGNDVLDASLINNFYGAVMGVWQGGNDTLNGGTGNIVMAAASGNDTVNTGTGADSVYASTTGSITGTDGNGATSWVFEDQVSGNATISDFIAGHDILYVTGGGSLSNVDVTGGNTIIALADGHTITLAGVTNALAHGSIVFTG